MITIDQKIAEYFNSWAPGGWPVGNLLACILALILTVGLCSAIGIEREKRGRSAGLRTHLLVGVGSCVIMLVSIYGFPASEDGHRDVARLAAQVITGIGFLGAGAIIYRNSGTKGLTTAATIFMAMAIGLACGSLNFILATLCTIVIVCVLTVFRKFEVKLNKVSPFIVVRTNPKAAILGKVLELAKQYDCIVNELHTEVMDNGSVEIKFFAVSNTSDFNTPAFIESLQKIEGVEYAGTLNGHKQ